MSYQEKKTLANMFGFILTMAIYGGYVLQVLRAGGVDLQNDLAFWGRTILTVVVIGIVLIIVSQIVLAIIYAMAEREQTDPSFEDELDKLIELKADRTSFVFVGVGFVTSMILLAAHQSAPVMINTIFFSFLGGELAAGAAKIYYYRRGI